MNLVDNSAKPLGPNTFDKHIENENAGTSYAPFPERQSPQMDRHLKREANDTDQSFPKDEAVDPSFNVNNFKNPFACDTSPTSQISREPSTARKTSAFETVSAARTNQELTTSRMDPKRTGHQGLSARTGVQQPWNSSSATSTNNTNSTTPQLRGPVRPAPPAILPASQRPDGRTRKVWNSSPGGGFSSMSPGMPTLGNALQMNSTGVNGAMGINEGVRKFDGGEMAPHFTMPNLPNMQQHTTTSRGLNRGQRNGAHRSMGDDPNLMVDLDMSMQRLMSTGGYNSRPPLLPQDTSRGSISTASLARTGSSPGQPSSPSALGWNGLSHTPDSATTPQGNVDQKFNWTSTGPIQDRRSNQLQLTGLGMPSLPVENFPSGVGSGGRAIFRPPGQGARIFHNSSAQGDASVNALSNDTNTLRRKNNYGSAEMARAHSEQMAMVPPRNMNMYSNYGDNFPQSAITGPQSVFTPHPQSSWQANSFAYPDQQSNITYVTDTNSGRKWSSQLIDEFRSSSKAGARWELKDVYNHIVEFSGDQSGSRFLQDKLKNANSDEKDHVFHEILPNAVPLMKDFYGNYVLQKIFEHGNLIHKAALVNSMKGHVHELSTQAYACRVVQKALCCILVQQQIALMQELNGKVMDCIKCENGNHVIQVAIAQVPLQHIPFVVTAIQHDVRYLSEHKYGCRIIQRVLESAKEQANFWLIPELHRCATMLIENQYGNYVYANIIEKGEEADRDRIIEVVRQNLVHYSKQKFASHVVEKCIRFGTHQHRRQFVEVFCSLNELGPEHLEHLIRDNFANYVLQCLIECLNEEDYLTFCQYVDPALQRAYYPCPSKQVENVANKMDKFYYRQRGLQYDRPA